MTAGQSGVPVDPLGEAPTTALDETQPADSEPAGSERHGQARGAWRFFRELVVLVLISFVVAAVIKTLLFQVFYIPSGSMEETLMIGDRVGVDKISYHFTDVKRGEVVVFRGGPSWVPESTVSEPQGPVEEVGSWLRGLVGLPTDERDFIKRVIAVGGDTVQCCDDAGRVVVNGTGLDEPYVYDNSPLESRSFGPVTVPDGRLFVLGDHRGLSADSRYHLDDGYSGTIDEGDVVGRAFVIIWPASRWGTLPIPAGFDAVPEPSPAGG